MTLLNNEWKRFEASSYLVSKDGRVYSEKTNKELKASVGSSGYKRVDFRIDGKTHPFNIHTLVAKLFVNGYKDGYVVNHIDGNKENNNSCNLEWVPQSRNVKHAYEIGKASQDKSKHPIVAINMATKQETIFDSVLKASQELGVDRSCIYKILKGTQKTSKGYSFRSA